MILEQLNAPIQFIYLAIIDCALPFHLLVYNRNLFFEISVFFLDIFNDLVLFLNHAPEVVGSVIADVLLKLLALEYVIAGVALNFYEVA